MTQPVSPPSEVLTVERDGHVAVLWLDNAARRNAMGPPFWRDLPEVVQALGDDADVRAVIVAARGPHFSTGLDLASFGELLGDGGGGDGGGGDGAAPSPAVQRHRTHRQIRAMQAAITAVADCPVPTIAAIHGACLGGGIDLITACDIRLASADAVFSVRETRIAIVADLGTLQRLPGIVGRGQAAELVYTGRDTSADEARALGLVNAVHPDVDALHAAARALAHEISANPPLAVRGSKAVMTAPDRPGVAEGLERVALWNSAFLPSHDLHEALAAFMEKRPPEFTGQ
jgi:enoyl-CoA hydratase